MSAQRTETKFNEQDVQRLFKRFLRMDTDLSGGLDLEELLKIRRISDNPLARRFIDVLDTDKSGHIDFNEFLQGISIFANQGCTDEKLRFIFGVYDVDRDGLLSNGDLFRALKMMIGENLDETSLQQIVDKTMRDCDKDADGRINFEEFKEYITKTNGPLIDKITIKEIL